MVADARNIQTILNCIDNSGAALVECALVVGQKRAARIGTTRPALGAILLFVSRLPPLPTPTL